MTVFFTAMNGTDNKVNADHVVEIRTVRNPDKRSSGRPYLTMAILKDGRDVELLWEVDKCVKACCSIIPAYAGFEVLSAWREKNETGVWRVPVIGWRTDEMGVEPVTADEDFQMGDNSCILYPDGQVVVPYDKTFPSEEAWLKDMEIKFEEQMLDEKQAAGNEKG